MSSIFSWRICSASFSGVTVVAQPLHRLPGRDLLGVDLLQRRALARARARWRSAAFAAGIVSSVRRAELVRHRQHPLDQPLDAARAPAARRRSSRSISSPESP